MQLKILSASSNSLLFSRLPRSILALLLGLLSVFSYAPWGAWGLIFPLLAGLYYVVDNAPNDRAAAWRGFCFGFGAFVAGVSWVYVSLSVFGGMVPALAALATLFFCAYCALFPALACWIYRRWRPSADISRAFFFAACWVLAEIFRGYFFSGFPWLLIGYAQTPGAGGSPLAGFAPILGVYGVSFLTALAAVLLARVACVFLPVPLIRNTRWPALFLLAVLLLGGGLRTIAWTEPAGAPLKVALLQGHIEQELKWVPERFAESLRIYFDLMQANPATLTILPETALPSFFHRLPPAYISALADLAKERGGDVLLGSALGDGERYTNSVVSLGQSPQQIYSKVHLVPFGEFVPPGFLWFMQQMKIPMSGFSSGDVTQSTLALAGQSVAINICYEDVFGEEIIRRVPTASILANASNTAWFGRSWAQAQHLQISRMRAAETGRPMLRATNTGMTAVIAPDGNVQAVLEPFTRGALLAEVQGMQGITPYVRYGNSLIFLLLLLCFLPSLRSCVASRAECRKSR